ncbi:MAG: S41 family peptidase [Anaerolineales bacterium]|nr:S41 family peptidase [Anaerolineales bacterium]
MKDRWALAGSLLLVIMVALAGLVGGIWLDREALLQLAPASVVPDDATDEFKLIAEAWQVIRERYVARQEVVPRQLTYGAISGMVDSLGDIGHSRFLTPEQVEEQRQAVEGRYEGIGAYVEMKDGRVVIASPIEGSPAEHAGLRAGDVIIAVDGTDTSSLSLTEVVSRTTGPAGTTVTLTILTSETGNLRDVVIERASIRVENVTWRRLPGTSVAHLRIAGFSEGVARDVEDALERIDREGLDGVVLDLRNSPGGLLDEAIGVASQFLADGNVLLQRDSEGRIEPVAVESGGVAPDVALVLLVNRGTASGAEVVTGALQDAERAQAVGERTFGAGTVLTEMRLSDGSVLLLAVREWLTPNGRVIWHDGLEPDVAVSLPADVAPLFPRLEDDLTAEVLMASGDTQLLRALDLLGAAPVQ